jgi:hypothetical protein
MENIQFCSGTAVAFRLRPRIPNLRDCGCSVLAFAPVSQARHSVTALDAISPTVTTVSREVVE